MSLILSTSAPTTSFAFPDLIRKGYTSCIPCHVSPAGGGVLTPYGRGVSAELSTISWEGAGAFAGIPQLDTWSDPSGLFTAATGDLQVDWRTVSYRLQPGEGEASTETIPMQLSAEGVIHMGKTTDLVLGYGQYGPTNSLESRVHYVQVRTSKWLQFRGGRFLPAFGLNIDDHTAFTRARTGFLQGFETLALEAHFESESVTSTFTRILGQNVDIVDSNDRWSFESERREAVASRSMLKIGARYYVGVSAYHDQATDIYGVFGVTAPIKDRLYLLFEYDQLKTETRSERIGFMRIGTELYSGIVFDTSISAVSQEQGTVTRYGIGTQLMPLPHLEFRGEARIDTEDTGQTTMFLIMSHLWL